MVASWPRPPAHAAGDNVIIDTVSDRGRFTLRPGALTLTSGTRRFVIYVLADGSDVTRRAYDGENQPGGPRGSLAPGGNDKGEYRSRVPVCN